VLLLRLVQQMSAAMLAIIAVHVVVVIAIAVGQTQALVDTTMVVVASVVAATRRLHLQRHRHLVQVGMPLIAQVVQISMLTTEVRS
jgi:hypothetical protein